MRNIILNIPHSSINGVFDDNIGGWEKNPFFINDCVHELTDWYTDFLFKTQNPMVKSVVFPYSRFVCDVERLENDEMESQGQGIIYTHYKGYERGEVNEKLLFELREKHHNELVKDIKENDVIIDCHSFTSKLHNCDICIGFNNDFSYDKDIVDIIINEFTKSSYSVAVNEPFSNSITPKTDVNYKSIMIEVNKKVYMNETTLKLNYNPRQWMRWFGCMERIYHKISEQP